MINQLNNLLQVKFNTTDYSKKAWRWENDNITLTFTDADYLYIGYKKQLHQYYFDIQTANTNTTVLTAEKYNGTTWETVDSFDETEGFSRSGFIYLSQGHDTQEFESYKFIRIKTNNTTTAITFRGIGLVFCSHSDLKEQEPNIDRFYPRDFSSHVLSLEAATKHIVRKINNSGKYKYNDIVVTAINRYDIFDINDLREACTYYALYKIMFNRADGDETDNYRLKAEEYLDAFNNVFKVFQGSKLSLDTDDSGIESEEENENAVKKASFVR